MSDIYMRIIMSAQDSASSVVKGLGSNLGMVGLRLAAVGVTAGAIAVKMAGDFQASMTRLVTSAGELPQNLKMVSDGILSMAVATGTSTQQLAAGMYYVESAGNRGADALRVLTVAAQGAKTENADLITVSKALTTVMTDYHMPVSQSAAAMNGLIATVQNGKTNLQELSKSMGAVLPIASSLHISFPQVAGAMDTMTNAGMSSRQAAMNLAHVLVALNAPSGVATKAMKEVGLSAQGVKDALVKQGLPAALQMIEDHVGKKFKAGSVEGTTALKDILGGLVGLKLAAQLTGPSLKTTEENARKVADAMKHGGSAVLGWSDIQHTFNFKMDQAKQVVETLGIKIGTALLPGIGNLVGKLPDLVSYISDFSKHSDVLVPILAGLGAILMMLVVPAVLSLAAGVIAATWPFLLVGLAVAGRVAVFKHLYDTKKGFKAFIDNFVAGFKLLASTIGHVLGSITNDEEKLRISHEQKFVQMKIAADTHTIAMAKKTIANYETQRKGILQKLKDTHDPAEKRELQHQLKMLDIHEQNAKKRLVLAEEDKKKQLKKQKELHDQMLEAQKWFGQRFLDMIGHWVGDQMSKLGGMVHGWVDHFGMMRDLVVKKAQEIVDGIVNWIKQLPGRVGGWIATMTRTVLDKLAGLATDVGNAGANIVKQIASGITGAIGNFIGGAMSAVGTFIHDHLPFSPAKRGPLRDLPYQGAMISKQIADGILAGQPHIGRALSQALQPRTGGLSSLSSFPVMRAGGASNTSTVNNTTGGASITNHITIQAQHLDPQEINTIARQLGDKLRAQMGTI